MSGKERNRLFSSASGRVFHDASVVSGVDAVSDSRSFALWDYNRDGWQDIALVNANAPLLNLFRNDIGTLATAEQSGNMIALRFVGGNTAPLPSDSYSTRDGYGVLVSIDVGDATLVREHRAGEGFAAQNSATMIVGIGHHDEARSVRVAWPSGWRQEVTGVAEGSLLTFFENPADSPDGRATVAESYRVPMATDQAGAPSPDLIMRRPLSVLPRLAGIARPPEYYMYTTMATWCAACSGQLPRIARIREHFGDRLMVFGVPIDPEDTAEKLVAYRRRRAPAYRLLTAFPLDDRAQLRDTLRESLQVDGLPSTIVTDSEGNVLQMSLGVPTVSELSQVMTGAEK